MKNIIEIKEDVQIGNIILEKGDRIQIINEVYSSISTELNLQYNEELKSALLYLQIANQCQSIGFFGATKYFNKAALEEFEHAKAFANLLHDTEYKPIIELQSVNSNIPEDLPGILKVALFHEKDITFNLQKLLTSIRQNNDVIVEQFLLTYINEQIEEEAKFQDLLDRIDAFSGQSNPAVLIEIDKELGEE